MNPLGRSDDCYDTVAEWVHFGTLVKLSLTQQRLVFHLSSMVICPPIAVAGAILIAFGSCAVAVRADMFDRLKLPGGQPGFPLVSPFN